MTGRPHKHPEEGPAVELVRVRLTGPQLEHLREIARREGFATEKHPGMSAAVDWLIRQDRLRASSESRP